MDQYTVESDEGNIPGISMQEIFKKYNINFDSKYFIKSDCEGAEKQFIGDRFCEEAIRNACFFFAEIHFSSEKTPEFITKWEVYNNWIHEMFEASHEIEYFVSSKKGGYGHYLLKNRGKNAKL